MVISNKANSEESTSMNIGKDKSDTDYTEGSSNTVKQEAQSPTLINQTYHSEENNDPAINE